VIVNDGQTIITDNNALFLMNYMQNSIFANKLTANFGGPRAIGAPQPDGWGACAPWPPPVPPPMETSLKSMNEHLSLHWK